MTDPIADMLTRIRNASAVKKAEVVLPMSKIKHNIAKIFEREGWVEKVEIIKEGSKKNKASQFDVLKIILKYKRSGAPVITHIKRISRPGLKVYVDKNHIPRVLNNLGMAVISTPRGLKTDKEARREKVGGEVICEIY